MRTGYQRIGRVDFIPRRFGPGYGNSGNGSGVARMPVSDMLSNFPVGVGSGRMAGLGYDFGYDEEGGGYGSAGTGADVGGYSGGGDVLASIFGKILDTVTNTYVSINTTQGRIAAAKAAANQKQAELQAILAAAMGRPTTTTVAAPTASTPRPVAAPVAVAASGTPGWVYAAGVAAVGLGLYAISGKRR